MKPFFFFFIMLFCHVQTVSSQEVYDLVLANATKAVNSPTSSYTQTQIAQFKRTSLIYLKRKAFEQVKEVPASFLDTQAYYLSEFVTLFFNEILKSKRLDEAKRKERIMLFMEASLSNPLYNDPDEETTISFITNGGEITPFCINTNWQKAYEAATAQLK